MLAKEIELFNTRFDIYFAIYYCADQMIYMEFECHDVLSFFPYPFLCKLSFFLSACTRNFHFQKAL